MSESVVQVVVGRSLLAPGDHGTVAGDDKDFCTQDERGAQGDAKQRSCVCGQPSHMVAQ